MGRLEPLDRKCVRPGTDLEAEVAGGTRKDLVGTVVEGREGRLVPVLAYQHHVGREEGRRQVLRTGWIHWSMADGTRAEIPHLTLQLVEESRHRRFWGIQELARKYQVGSVEGSGRRQGGVLPRD